MEGSIASAIVPAYASTDKRNKTKFASVDKILDRLDVPKNDRIGVYIHYKRFADDCFNSAVDNDVLY